MTEDEAMTEESAPEELSVEEFMELSEAGPARGKVDDKELLEYLVTAKRTSALAEHFGVSYSAMLARLNRLLRDKKVVRRHRAREAFWIAATAVPKVPAT